jgi:hypothetical protein
MPRAFLPKKVWARKTRYWPVATLVPLRVTWQVERGWELFRRVSAKSLVAPARRNMLHSTVRRCRHIAYKFYLRQAVSPFNAPSLKPLARLPRFPVSTSKNASLQREGTRETPYHKTADDRLQHLHPAQNAVSID